VPASAALVARYGTRYDAIRRQVGVAVLRLWDRFGAIDDLDAFAAPAAELSAAAQAQTAAVVDAYLASYLDTTPVGVEPVIRNGADLVDVYRRAGVTARYRISQGADFDTAMAAARARAQNLATTDVVLAHQGAAAEVLAERRVVGYRRVLTGGSCKLCATASTQRYHADRLMPIHGHCDCRIAPIVGDDDPGHIINHQLLDRLQQSGPQYWKAKGFVDADGNPVNPTEIASVTDTAVREHGELGPMLTDARDTFTGPSGIPR